MHFFLRPVCFSTLLAFLFLQTIVSAQISGIASPGPKGIYLTLGKSIPCGKAVSSYLIERKEKAGSWSQIAEVRIPATFPEFLAKIESSKTALPAQPFPSQDKLKAMYHKAVQTGDADSLGKRIQYAVRIALGIMYYDADAKTSGEYQYKITGISPSGVKQEPVISNLVIMPYTAVFDDLMLSETSRDEKMVFIKWKSAGNKPAPLFMVFRIENNKSAAASGATSHYSMNDTTYYTFQDSSVRILSNEKLEYFMAPYDLLGNPGKQSQVAVITKDNFIKAFFMKMNVSKVPDRTATRISWHFSDPVTVKSIDLYRSLQPDKGFVKISSFSRTDSVYQDEVIRPDKAHYYYLQANARNGNRFKMSEKLFSAPYMPTKPQAPVLLSATGVPAGIKLTIGVDDILASGIRIFRTDGITEAMAAVSGLLRKGDSSLFMFTDSSQTLSGRRNYTYAARAESADGVVSDMSNTATAKPLGSMVPFPPAYLKVFAEGKTIRLFWEDMKESDPGIAGYLIMRKTLKPAGNSSGVFIPIAGEKNPFNLNSYTDSTVAAGDAYIYSVQAIDSEKICSVQKTFATISIDGTEPLPPSGVQLIRIHNGNKLSWGQTTFPGIKAFNLYRYVGRQEPVLLETVPAAATDYLDSTAETGELFTYYIRSVTQDGRESVKSETVSSK